MSPAPPADGPPGTILHAGCVALNGRGLLIRGAAGRGKSTLALRLMAHGAALVADDRTRIARQGGILFASAPPTLPPLIEARGLGLLRADLLAQAALAAVVDLDRASEGRLPRPATCDILGLPLPLLAGGDLPHLDAMLIQYLKAGLADTP
ncbi:HPr kinase/phosphorylase [Oceaniglobus roseus]|uniref:HPr kinase/phosphorylase n=1 Tax=Oceaniglobus roseus TaxID=1737570 RepID=UPI000C7EC6F6|nr:serine kinase [Kandeliimicrobium roseum]